MIILIDNEPKGLPRQDLDELLLETAMLENEYWTACLDSLDDRELQRKMRSLAYYSRARSLFLHGFFARVLDCPPTGTALDDDLGPSLSFLLWKMFLETREGKVVLEGPPLPETPKDVLEQAGLFFMRGFILGTFAFEKIAELDCRTENRVS